MAVITPPAMVDDTGDGKSGTKITKAFLESMLTAVDDVTHSTTNPTLTPKGIIDEVKAARGTLATLDARFDVEHNDDGTHKLGTALATIDQIRDAMGALNMLSNEDFNIWPAGDTALPSHWFGVFTPQRTGVGLADTKRKHGKYALRVTGNGAVIPEVLYQALSVAAFADFAALKGRKVTFGIRVYTTAAGVTARIADGATSTGSSPHSGSPTGGPEGDGWEWLTVTHTISGSANALTVSVLGTGVADVFYISGGTFVLGEVTPTDWIPSPRSIRSLQMPYSVPAVATDVANFTFPRPALVLEIRLHVRTAVTTTPLIVDANHWDGSAFQSMYSTKPQVAVGVKDGYDLPDGTYRYRCFAGAEAGAGVITNAQLSMDIDQIGGVGSGLDLQIEVRYLQYDRALEGILGWND